MYLPVVSLASLLYDDVVHALRDRPAASAAPPSVVRKVLPASFAVDAVEGEVLAVLPKGRELLLLVNHPVAPPVVVAVAAGLLVAAVLPNGEVLLLLLWLVLLPNGMLLLPFALNMLQSLPILQSK